MHTRTNNTLLPFVAPIMDQRPTLLLTGATKGIGRAIADRFAPHCARMALIARTAADLQTVRQELQTIAPECRIEVFPCDLADAEAVQNLCQTLKAGYETVDILINNAGAYLPGTLLEEPNGTLEHMMAVNLYAPYHLSRAVWHQMPRGSHIFNIASVASREGYIGKGSYGITKAALLSFHHSMRYELKDKGIRTTAILPGPTWSDSWTGADLPADRLLQASEVAEAIWSAWQLPPNAVIEEITIRPQLGDL
ncbi:SDR family oxidoreductase [Phaeodactylibacter xiamenensis]|uniref:SDR family oxidoreductase n=1 Tax=Phaeodactylibacter xiamenensis TaxID=1524460 RepID=UPI0024A91F68|nr:SDR family oxidoreductase [Phaeodactylibacter xiamenensis]